MLDKTDLPGLIRSIYLGCSNNGEKSGSSEEEEHAIKVKQEKKVKDTLKDQRRYRARKSTFQHQRTPSAPTGCGVMDAVV